MKNIKAVLMDKPLQGAKHIHFIEQEQQYVTCYTSTTPFYWLQCITLVQQHWGEKQKSRKIKTNSV